MNSFNIYDDPPVTVTISRRIKPGCESAFEQVVVGITAAAKTFEGHLDINVFRSSDLRTPEYWIIFKFDRMSNLRRWEESKVRHEWLQHIKKFSLGCPETRIVRGLETWFTLPLQRTITPPRYKMALITWLAIFPLIVVVNALFEPLLSQLSSIERSLFLTVVLVLLMTYILMPCMTKLFEGWLYSRKIKPFKKQKS